MGIPRGLSGNDVMAEGAVRFWAGLEHRGPLCKEHTAHRVRRRQSIAAVGESKRCARMVNLRANDTAFKSPFTAFGATVKSTVSSAKTLDDSAIFASIGEHC